MLLHAIEAMEGSRTPAAAPGGAATTNAQSLEAAGEAPRTEDPPPRPIAELLADLDELVGLAGVKHEVKLVTNLLRVQKIRLSRGLPVLDPSRHVISTGNPAPGQPTDPRLHTRTHHTHDASSPGNPRKTHQLGT